MPAVRRLNMAVRRIWITLRLLMTRVGLLLKKVDQSKNPALLNRQFLSMDS